MFGLDLLFTLILGGLMYGLVALAVISYAAYRKNSIVPEIELTKDYGTASYQKKFTDQQKAARDMWECAQVFSFAWPVELVVGAALGGWRAFKHGITYLVNLTGQRAQTATDRKILAKLELAREEAEAIGNDSQRTQALASIDKLMSQHARNHLALTGNK